MPTVLATDMTLAQLRDRFGLGRSPAPNFFSEDFSTDREIIVREITVREITVREITAAERTILDRVQQNYLSQLEFQTLNEETVKMPWVSDSLVSPLLDIAGVYRYPFAIDSEVSVEIQESDENGVVLKGRIDTLILRDQLWILVVESKHTRFSVQAAVPQALSYLLAKPQPEQAGYALITNGGEFLFLKLVNSGIPTYGFSETFSLLNVGNDLYKVLAILKQITVL